MYNDAEHSTFPKFNGLYNDAFVYDYYACMIVGDVVTITCNHRLFANHTSLSLIS